MAVTLKVAWLPIPDEVRPRCEPTRDTHYFHFSAIRRIAAALEAEFPDHVRWFDPTPCFCDQQKCRIMENGQMLYVDFNDISVAGSRMIADALKSLVQWDLRHNTQ